MTLGLTSPHTKGPAVSRAQSKLRRAGFLDGKADGEFGPETARAVRKAKFWLGFSLRQLQDHGGETYGEILDRLLDDFIAKRPLPLVYRTRRAARLRARAAAAKAAATVPLRTLANAKRHACPAAECQEHPAGSNRVSWASGWYGIVGAWCAMGLTRFAVDAGSRSFSRGRVAAYVPNLVHYATVGLYGFRRTYRPASGAGVAYDWDGDGVHDHVEVVDQPPASMAPGTPFTTVGCNTSSDDHGSQSNGGGCFHRTRAVMPGSRTFFFSYT